VCPAATEPAYTAIRALVSPEPPDHIGVNARGDGTAIGLKVQGKAQFSRSGRTYVSAGHATRAVTYAGVPTSSLVIATLQTYRSGVYIAATVPAAGKFTIYLEKAVSGTTHVAFFIINQACQESKSA
jgi:hypothetical protein